MGKPSKAVMDFMAKYKVDSDEIWEVHGSTWVVKHKALERVASEVEIIWEKPELNVVDMAQGFAVVLMTGRLGDRIEFSFGEASPKNNKNSYPIAMAEKRAKDRVILKLLTAHGGLYSESEADEFVQPRKNPHTTQPEDIFEEISGDIPPDPTQPRMLVKKARPEFGVLIKEMQRIQDVTELKEWGLAKRDDINSLPGKWPDHFRGEYAKHQKSIMNGGAI